MKKFKVVFKKIIYYNIVLVSVVLSGVFLASCMKQNSFFQNDFNDPNGLTPEILDMTKDKAVKFRQEINTELLKRGVTSL